MPLTGPMAVLRTPLDRRTRARQEDEAGYYYPLSLSSRPLTGFALHLFYAAIGVNLLNLEIGNSGNRHTIARGVRNVHYANSLSDSI